MLLCRSADGGVIIVDGGDVVGDELLSEPISLFITSAEAQHRAASVMPSALDAGGTFAYFPVDDRLAHLALARVARHAQSGQGGQSGQSRTKRAEPRDLRPIW